MVNTRSGAGGNLPPKVKSIPKAISKKKKKTSPQKRPMLFSTLSEIVFDFDKPKPRICVLPKFTSKLQNLHTEQVSPTLTSQTQNSPFESSRPWTPPPFDDRISVSIPKVDALLSSLQQNVPSKPAGVRRYELFVKDAPFEASTDDILRKWLSKVFSSGMTWIGALSQLPLSLKNQARKIMMSNHARLYI
jgi:hypothetical protein